MNKTNVNFLKDAISNKEGVNFLSIDLLSRKENETKERKKPNLFMFLLDNSGSMNCYEYDRELTRLNFAKRAINNFIDNLEEDDKIGLVTFNSYVDLVIPVQKSTKKNELKNKVNNINANYCTNMGLGLDLARETITKADIEKYNCKIIVLSDGEINEGKKEEELVKDSEICIENGITISSLGIGEYYNSKLMNDICTGLFYHLNSLSILDKILEKELSLNNKILYNNVKITIKNNGLIELKENLNDFKEKNYDNCKVIYIGNLISNINKNILIELENELEKEDIDFEIIINFNKEESITIKKRLKVVDKEKLTEFKENEKILKLVSECLKRKTIQETSLSYMQFRDMNKVNSCNNKLKNKFNQLSNSMGIENHFEKVFNDSIIEVNSFSNNYKSSSLSDLKNSYCLNSSKKL